MNINNFWPQETRTLPTTNEVLKTWEKTWDLKLPRLLKDLYMIHNGTIDSIGELDNMYPIDDDSFSPSELKENVSDLYDCFISNEDYKEDIIKLIKDLRNQDLITPFASYGSYILCLDWNANGRNNEPEIGLFSWNIENDFWYKIKEKSLTDYLKKIKL